MKQLFLAIVILALIIAKSAHAGQAEYDDCILEHLKNAKIDVAAHLIKQACVENYKSPSFISEKRRTYNLCILEHLKGVESIQAVMDMKAACVRKYK